MFGGATEKEVENCNPRHQLASQKAQEFTSKTLQTKLQFFDFQSRAGEQVGEMGLGPVPASLDSAASLVVFNTAVCPYTEQEESLGADKPAAR